MIIPVYNAEHTLRDCVRAVLAQSFDNLELLLINDGSRDDSGSICDAFAEADSRVRAFHQENQGVSAARNLGLSRAEGEYITFLDADDIVPPDYLKILHNACREADISVCDVVSVQEGRELTRFTHPDGILTRTEALNLLLTRRRINSGPCAKLFRRDMLEGLKFPPLKAYEDILLVRDAFDRAARIAVTDKTEYRYIQNPEGAMSRFFKAPSTDIIRATEDILYFIITRRELSPDTLYITASHLMQYVLDVVQSKTADEFVCQSRMLYHRYLRHIIGCPAFPWKEKIVFALFTAGWLYTDGRLEKV